jgi:hypothetical protein
MIPPGVPSDMTWSAIAPVAGPFRVIVRQCTLRARYVAGVVPAMDVGSRGPSGALDPLRRCELRGTFYHVYSGLATLAIVTSLTASCASRSHAADDPATFHPSAVSTAPPILLDTVKPLYQIGEQITWEVSLQGIEGGRARMAIGQTALVDGKPVLALHADAESSGLLAVVKTVHDEVSTWVDASTGLPLRTVGDSNTSGKELHAEVSFDHAAHKAQIAYQVASGPKQTTGLHLADVAQLLALLDRLVDSGKSVIVIEHHQAVMAHADWIIDLGPGAGHDGGRVVFEGTPADLVAARSTLTGEHLAAYVTS